MVAGPDRAELIAGHHLEVGDTSRIPEGRVEQVVIDLHRVALPDAKADRAADIIENGLGARHDVGVTRIQLDCHVSARNVEPDTADRDVFLVGDHAADRMGVAEVAVGAQHTLYGAADRHAALHLRECLGLVLPVDLDVAHGALLFFFECSDQRGWI